MNIDADDLRRELCEHITRLLELIHPDRHNGSDLSHSLTIWLLEMRQHLGGK